MRTLNRYTERPEEREIIRAGNGKAWCFVRRNIVSETVTDEEGQDRTEYTAEEFSAKVVDTPDLEITDEFAEKLIAIETELAAKAVRQKRDALLEASDNEMLPDRHKQTSNEYKAWAAYRQALRDIPMQDGFPFGVDWPEKK